MVRLRIFLIISMVSSWLVANPIISKIMNSSDVGYMVIHHTDESSCSLRGKKVIINANQIFEHLFLLEPGKPSLILRPAYYVDRNSKTKVDFLDSNFEYIPEKLNQAFNFWKQEKGKSWRKIKTAQQWMDQWIGGDILVFPHDVQLFGYLRNSSRVIIKNNNREQHSWLSFAKGIFAKLLQEIDIIQEKNRPIFVKMHALHGEGGVCVDGSVERI